MAGACANTLYLAKGCVTSVNVKRIVTLSGSRVAQLFITQSRIALANHYKTGYTHTTYIYPHLPFVIHKR